MATKTYAQLIQQAQQQLPKRPELCQRLLCDRLEWTLTDFMLKAHQVVPLEVDQHYAKDMEELLAGKPLQYIVGKEWFYGRSFKVTENTLIPRPETELLVEHALKELSGCAKARVLDVGTGSGAIGLTLKCERPQDEVVLCDISSGALDVAKINAEHLGVEVALVRSDVFSHINGRFDCIVSNPPYIAAEEIEEMDEHVLNYEPSIALFAEKQGYAIYQKIAQEIVQYLKPNGCAVFECGYRQAEVLKRMFQQVFPQKEVVVYQDYAGLNRGIIVRKGNQ